MFTGIVTDIGTIEKVEPMNEGVRLRVRTNYDPATIDMGASIAHSGTCLTVTALPEEGANARWFEVEAWEEALRLTTISAWTVSQKINLERSLKIGDELGGHIVTGHVDDIGRIVSVVPVGDSVTVTVAAPAALAAHIAPKGSVTVDGVSLTVNDVIDQPDGEAHFTLNIIPHTQEMTTLNEAAAGRPVNLEIDILARYLARMQARG